MLIVNGSALKLDSQTVSKNIPATFIKNNTLGQGVGIYRDNKFELCDFDLIAIKKLYDNDSYTQIAINKYVDLLFKRGFFLNSSNPEAKKYLSHRFRIYRKSTGISFEKLLKQIAQSLVLYANSYIWKKYLKTEEVRRFTKISTNNEEVIAGLFPMHSASIFVKRDKYNNVLKYQQRDIALSFEGKDGYNYIPDVPYGLEIKEWPEYRVDEIYHVAINQEPGYIFGIPNLFSVIEDVKALRMIEEHAARLIYRNLFPLYHVKVGVAEPGMQASLEEVEEMKENYEMLSFDGTLITNERAEVKVVGAEGQSLDPAGTLKYFEDRTFTGLGVSSVQMGRDTSNRATADALTTEMHDRAEAFQNAISLFAEQLFEDLLEEGGFDVEDEKVKVTLNWPEIELETMIKRENSIIYKWINNAITADEMRNELGYDPWTDEDKKNLFFEIVTKTIDENKINKQAENQAKPENQHGQKTGPKKKTENYNSFNHSNSVTYYIEKVDQDIKLIMEEVKREDCDMVTVVEKLSNICNTLKNTMNGFDIENFMNVVDMIVCAIEDRILNTDYVVEKSITDFIFNSISTDDKSEEDIKFNIMDTDCISDPAGGRVDDVYSMCELKAVKECQ